jgi:hypothetical protein
MKKILYLATIIISVCLVPISAQINITLPKIGLPKKEDVTSKVKPGSNSAVQRSNRQFVLDDGFTFFDAEPLQEYSAPARRQVGVGWHLRSYLRMFGTAPNRSGFNLVVSKSGKQLVKIRCEGTAYRKSEDPVPENRNVSEDDYLIADWLGCEDKTKSIKDVGKLDVQVYYFDGDTDQEKLLRNYKIEVREATRVRGLATAPVVDVPHYYIQRHAETAAAILHVRPIRYPNYFRIRGDGDFHVGNRYDLLSASGPHDGRYDLKIGISLLAGRASDGSSHPSLARPANEDGQVSTRSSNRSTSFST